MRTWFNKLARNTLDDYKLHMYKTMIFAALVMTHSHSNIIRANVSVLGTE